MREFTYDAAVAGKWAARIFGALFLLFFVVFQVSEGPRPWDLTARQLVEAAGLLILMSGLVVAWIREGMGGLLIIAGFAFMALLNRRNLYLVPMWIPVGVGILHLLCWSRLRAVK